MNDLQRVVGRIRKFRDARDWMQFHQPKDMAAGIAIEAAELMEEEVADIGIFLLELADNLDIDLLDAIEAKIEKNAEKYPVEKAKGRSDKYTEL
jgi:dCTP diphosphatase